MSQAKNEGIQNAERVKGFLDDVLKNKGGTSTDPDEFIKLNKAIEALPAKVKKAISNSNPLIGHIQNLALHINAKRTKLKSEVTQKGKGAYFEEKKKESIDGRLKGINNQFRREMYGRRSTLKLQDVQKAVDAYIASPDEEQQSSATTTSSRRGRFVFGDSPEETSTSKQTKKPGWYQTAVTALTGGKSSKQQETDPYSPPDLSDVFSPEEPGMFGRVKEWWSGETSEEFTSGDSSKEQQ